MMMKILIIPGSLRPNSVGNKLIAYVEDELRRHEGVDVEVVKAEAITLPLFDAVASPAAGVEIHHQDVKAWSKQVAAADGFVFMTPEYNNSVSPVQKNYVDWLYSEWHGKKVACVNYNHYDKKSAAEALMSILDSVKAEVVRPVAYLRFGQEIDKIGNVLDAGSLQYKIAATVSALVE